MSFDPSSLFSLGEQGAWYDPADPATLWQDSAGTIAVTAAGQSVARIDDKSGNAHHLTANGFPATYEVDSEGRPYMLFDGVDDRLTVAWALAFPFDRISRIRQLGWTAGKRLFMSGGSGILNQRSGSPRLNINDGITDVVITAELALGVTGTVTERHVANAQRIAINSGDYISGDAGATAPGSTYSIGAQSNGSTAANFRLYGQIIRAGSLTDQEIADVRTWLAGEPPAPPGGRRRARHSWWI